MSLNPSDKTIAFVIKPLLLIVCLVPFIALVIGAVNNTLGTNPVETMTHETGEWTLRFLLLTLMITPLWYF